MHHDPAYNHYLPVAVHVARREATRAMQATRDGMDGFRTFQDRFVETLFTRFVEGRRLEGPTLARLVGEAAQAYRSLVPMVMREDAQAATRTRPKGESREILALAAYAASTEGGETKSLMALRLYVDRKRARVDQEHLGIGYTKHAMIRAMERDLVSRTGGFRELDAALVSYQGIVAAWRFARRAGAVSLDHHLHLPFAEGLLLGQMLPSRRGAWGLRTLVDRSTADATDLPPNPFRSELDAEGPYLSEWVCRSAVEEDKLSLPQLDYRDAVVAFLDRHADLFASVNAGSAWTGVAEDRKLSFAKVGPYLEAAGLELARIATAPRFAAVYQDRRDQETNPLFLRDLAA